MAPPNFPTFTEPREYPVPTVNVVILNDSDDVLLIERGKEPNRGAYIVPGGRFDVTDNNLESAAIREVQEETGLAVELEHLVGVRAELRKPPIDSRFHVVETVYTARIISGAPRKTDEASSFQWVPIERAARMKLGFFHQEFMQTCLEKREQGTLIPVARAMYREYFDRPYTYLVQNEYPRPAVKAIILNDKQEILLGRRGQYPYKGMWDLIGGNMHGGETLEACLLREIKEELGVDAKIDDLFHVYSDKGKNPKFSGVGFVYGASVERQEFRKNIEIMDFQYFALDNVPEHIAFHNEDVIADLRDRI